MEHIFNKWFAEHFDDDMRLDHTSVCDLMREAFNAGLMYGVAATYDSELLEQIEYYLVEKGI